MKFCYIFHVIGTLTMEHIEMALESLRLQQPFHWDRFILYNASDLPSDEIMALIPREFFDRVEDFGPGARSSLKSCSADWLTQMDEIDGADRYFCHKADFYLPPWVCVEFERIKKKGDFLVLFNKYDMKSRATIADIRRYANLRWKEGLKEPDRGTYQNHLGFLAIPFMQVKGNADGTMHGYTDGVRDMYRPKLEEIVSHWGVSLSFRALDVQHPRLLHRDPAFFACHMWHESPDRKDWNKNMSPDERF
jgi:hypothetical protein